MGSKDDEQGLGEPLQIQYSRGSNRLNRLVSKIDEADAEARYREEEANNKVVGDPNVSSSSSIEHEKTIVAWEPNDPENPYKWSGRKKSWILFITMMTILNSTMGSALPSNAVPYMAAEWGIESQTQKVLPISVYLVGYVMGPVVWAPLSEQFGRRTPTLSTFAIFCVFTMACALAPSWPAFIVFRFFTGVFASAPIAIVAGIFADIYDDPVSRGRAMAVFMAATLFGPLFAPIISGFCSTTIGWRWTFWIGLIYAGATMIPLVLLPETYGPVLLARRAAKIRKADPSARVVAPHELEDTDFKQLATVVLTRPVRMIIFEPLVNTTCAYLSLCYAIFYMSFQAYPLIFQGIYKLSPGVCGLTYMAMGVGAVLSVPLFWAYDGILLRAQARNAPWTRNEEYRRLPIACVGGPLFVISLFWLGWSAKESVHFVVPMLAGIPFSIGFLFIFMALLNYLVDAYEIFAASANAAASCSRSLLATVLPLAAGPMFERLGIAGACSLLGGLSLLMCAIPFIFIWQGENIRSKSRFCIALKERKAEMERKVELQRQRAQQRSERIGEVPKEEV